MAEERRLRIVDYIRLKGPVTPKQISEALSIAHGTLSVDMSVLRATGKIRWHLGIKGILEIVEETKNE